MKDVHKMELKHKQDRTINKIKPEIAEEMSFFSTTIDNKSPKTKTQKWYHTLNKETNKHKNNKCQGQMVTYLLILLSFPLYVGALPLNSLIFNNHHRHHHHLLLLVCIIFHLSFL